MSKTVSSALSRNLSGFEQSIKIKEVKCFSEQLVHRNMFNPLFNASQMTLVTAGAAG